MGSGVSSVDPNVDEALLEGLENRVSELKKVFSQKIIDDELFI